MRTTGNVVFFHALFPVFCILFLAQTCICKDAVVPDNYRILQSVRTADELVFSKFPSCYFVPLTLSGAIADDMQKSLSAIHLETPSYVEVLDKKHTFHLLLANDSYSLETRDLLAGVMNPVEMINIVVSSALRYRSDDQLSAMARETYLSTTPVCFGKKPALQCVLVPKGQYFAYTYDDRGAYIRESWLTKIVCVIDTASHFVNELALTRHARIITVGMQAKPAADSSSVVYSFTYDTIQAVSVPVGMTLSVNGKVSFVIKATYRIEKKSIVFDTRQICYPASATQTLSCLMMTYGTYTTDEIPSAAMKPAKPKEYTEHMEKAAILCRKALDCIRNGTLDAAIPLLDKAVSSYPETPQAAEARQLLRGLPGNHVAR